MGSSPIGVICLDLVQAQQKNNISVWKPQQSSC